MRVNSIQILRAVAALLVVYEHSMDVQMKFGTSWQQKFYHLDNFGCIGVDLFFVISGFIITYVATKYKGLNEGIYFLEKRWFRINPVYYIATAAFLGVYLLYNHINHVPSETYYRQTIRSLMDSILILPTSESIKSFSPLLIVGWTLAFEWLFYLLFFFLITASIKHKSLFLLAVILLLIGVGQLLRPDDLRLQFITNPIMLEFLLGVIICRLYASTVKFPVWFGIMLLSLAIISYLLLIGFGNDHIWYYNSTINGRYSLTRFILWGIPSACIVAGCVLMEKNGKLMKVWNNRVLLLAGNASYSIYLLHFTILCLFMLLYKKAGLFMSPDVMIWVQFIVAVSISIAFYKLVERPLLKWLENKTLWPTARLKKTKSIIVGSKEMVRTEPVAG